MADERKTSEPHDRLTRIADAMSDALYAHPEYQDDKCVIMLDDGKRGGIGIFGYEDENEAMIDLFMHLKAMFKVNGKTLDLLFLGEEGVTKA